MQSITQQSKYFRQGAQKEEEILENFCGFLGSVNIFCYDTIINYKGRKVSLHSIKCGNFDNPPMVFVHGFGGSLLAFYKIFMTLSEKFKVFAFDWPGMGLSDRWDFQLENKSEAIINFFVDILEEWRKANGIEVFTLVGHSFGGYIAANYYFKYPDRIHTLFLFSPLGSTHTKQVQNQEEMDKKDIIDDQNNLLENQSSGTEGEEKINKKNNCRNSQQNDSKQNSETLSQYFSKRIFKYVKENRYTPQSVLNKWFIPKRYCISKIVDQALLKASEAEKKVFREYFEAIFSLPSCNDSYIHDIINYPSLSPVFSLEELFDSVQYQSWEQHKKKNIHVLFGDSDFIDSTGCQNLFDRQIWIGSFRFLKNSSHSIMIDSPDQVCKTLIEPRQVTLFSQISFSTQEMQ